MSNINKVVKFTNITNSDFTHAYGGQPFFVKAGESVMLPFDLANHLAKHLAQRIFIQEDKSVTGHDPNDKTSGLGRPLWDDQAIALMKTKILGEVFEEAAPRPRTEAEILKARVDELEKKFAHAPVEGTSTTYKDKAEVIAALEAKKATFDRRASKATLEKHLAELETNGNESPAIQ